MTDDERQDFSPSRTKVEAFDTLPEVKQFDEIMRGVYADFSLTKLKGKSWMVISGRLH